MDELLDTIPCGFLRLADDGTIQIANATLCGLLGHEAGALAGHHVDRLLSPGARIFYQTHVFPLLRVQGEVNEIYLSLRAADGTDLPVLLNAVRRAHEGVSDWAIVVMRRRNRFEDELLQARKAAEEANRVKDRFLSMMSHDLRAPLSGISMSAQIMAGGATGPVTDRQRTELERIKGASQYVLRLVKDLLNFARLRSGRAEVRIEPVSVTDVLTHATSMVQHLFDDEGLALDVEAAQTGLRALADGDRLQQVVLNLLTNAAKFTEPGGRVRIAATASDGQVLVRIIDTGRGIAADRLERVFEPFVQVEGSRRGDDGSVGLGLAISRELARSMGGDLTVESTLGEGSTFTVTLRQASAGAD